MLDELIDVIETLKTRIKKHGDTLRANETRTRVSLIDPLLTILGWDTADPGLVAMEFNVGSGRADYAHLSENGEPRVFIEAKRLGESLSNHRSQLVTYAVELGTPYSILTDGDRWEVYDTFKQVPMDQKRIMDIWISRDESAKLSLQLLLLWRANVIKDSPQRTPEPIDCVKSLSLPVPNPAPKTLPEASPGEGWTRLDKLVVGEMRDYPPGIRFPNGEERPIRNWKHIFVEVGEFLIRRGILPPDSCTFHPKATLGIDTKQIHPKAKRRFSNGLYWRCPGGAKNAIQASLLLMEHFEEKPSQIRLKTG